MKKGQKKTVLASLGHEPKNTTSEVPELAIHERTVRMVVNAGANPVVQTGLGHGPVSFSMTRRPLRDWRWW